MSDPTTVPQGVRVGVVPAANGKRRVQVCAGTACHVAGAPRITEAIEQELGVPDGGTTPDMSFTLDSVACMGACSQAPVMRIDADTFGNLTPDSTRKYMLEVLDELGLSAADLAGGASAPEAAPETAPEAATPTASDTSEGRRP